jgi:hypothetical protein
MFNARTQLNALIADPSFTSLVAKARTKAASASRGVASAPADEAIDETLQLAKVAAAQLMESLDAARDLRAKKVAYVTRMLSLAEAVV